MAIKEYYDIAVIGGGPAGMAAAYSAKMSNPKIDVIIIDREKSLGGILPQCIHTGFGIMEFQEELTGPEYAFRWIEKIQSSGIEVYTDSIVLSLNPAGRLREFNEIILSGEKTGIATINTKSVILAMGCREKPRGVLGIPGSRCSGIFTAGSAQRFVNVEGLMPGKNVVILGSGDIGLIMARRITLEGGKVKLVCERMDRPGGLERNVVQCLEDFGIPLLLSSTILKISGKKRVESVTVGQFDKNGNLIKDSIKKISCDTVLLSVGLIPENELSKKAGVLQNSMTGGPFVDEYFQTCVKGIFACGNVLKVYDLVDNVSEDALKAGKYAAEYVKGKLPASNIKTIPEKQANTGKKEMENKLIKRDDGTRYLTCTICPLGCLLEISKNSSGEYDIKGNKCKRGITYAHNEIISPVRTLTTCAYCVVKEEKGTEISYSRREIAVRTNNPIPLSLLKKAARKVRNLKIDGQVEKGDVLIKNILGTGADVIVTRP